MCSRNNRFLLSTCVQILAFGALTSLPAHAEFKWTPPDEPDQIEDMAPDVFMVDGESSSLESGSALPEYYDSPRIDHNQAIEIHPPIEIKVLEESRADTGTEPVEIKTITLTGDDDVDMPEPIEDVEPVSPSLILNPYPLESGDLPPVDEEEEVAIETPTPPRNDSRVSWNESVTYEVIEGFGMEMPLALALSQIVPPEYAYSFSGGVNPGMRLSWEGGKAWNEVLNDALSPLGIEALIHGKRVVLKPDGSQPVLKPVVVTEPAVEVAEESPEQAMSASLETRPVEYVETPAEPRSVVLDKTNADEQEPKDDASTLVENLMQPLDTFEDNENAAAEPAVEVVETAPADEPVFKPEIILDEQEKEEEEYAKKLEEGSPFGDASEPVELLPVSDMPEEEAPSAPIMPAPFEEEEELDMPMQASDVIDEDLILPSTEEVEELEPVSKFRDAPSNKIRIWEAKRSSNLQKILEEWSAKERILLEWNTSERYVLDYDVFISGTYQNAIDILFKKGLKKAPAYVLNEMPYSIIVQEEN